MVQIIAGGAQNDTLIGGNSSNNLIYGNEGADSIRAGALGDRVYGWTGSDTILGSDVNDALGGDQDADSILGGLGDDQIYGGDSNDTLQGNQGEDFILGDDGDDSVNGGQGDDVLFGWNGNDTLAGDLGNDRLSGENGDDLLQGGDGDDQIHGIYDNNRYEGGAGRDIYFIAPGDATIDANDKIDTIGDFDLGTVVANGGTPVDLIDLSQLGVSSFSALQQLMSEITVGTRVDTRIDFSLQYDRILVIEGVRMNQLFPPHFRFPGSNTAPVANADSYNVAVDGLLNASSVLNNDTDGNGDFLTAQLVSGPAHAASGSFTFNADGSFSYRPAAGYQGIDTFTYVARDALLSSSTATVTIQVGTPVSDGIVTGTSGNDNIVLNYVDPSDGDRVTTGNDTIVGAGGNDTITGDAGTDTFRFTFNGAGGNGIDRVTDTGGNIVINSITVAGTAVATSNPNVFTLTVGGTAFTLTKVGTDLEISIGSNTSEKVILANFPGDWNINLPTGDGVVDGTSGNDNILLGYVDAQGDRVTTGNDIIAAAGGNDTITGDAGTDTFRFTFNGAGGNGIDRVTDTGGNIVINSITVAGTAVATSNPNVFTLTVGGTAFTLTKVGADLEITIGSNTSEKVILANFPGDWNINLPTGDGVVDGTSSNDVIGLGYVDAQGDRVTTGNDIIAAAGGNDFINGDAGTDTYRFTFNGAGGNGIDRVTDTGGNIVINSITVAGTAVSTGTPNVYTLTVGGTAFTLTKVGADLEITIGSNTSEKVILTNFPGDWNINIPTADGIVDGTSGNDNIALGYVDAQGDRVTTGSDTIVAAGGNDTITGDAGTDTFRFTFNGAGGNGIDRVTDTGGNIVINSITVAGTAVATSNPNVFTLTVGGTVFTLTKVGTDLEINIGTNTSEKVILANFPGDWNIDLPNPADGIVNGTATGEVIALGQYVDTDGDRVTTGNDSVRGLDGNDTIASDSGNDSVDAGNGDDVVYANAGNDSVFGNAGNDFILGDDGDDTVDGGLGADTIFGGDGNDVLNGNDGGDRIGGDRGNDTLNGNAGNDSLFGWDGNDLLLGGDGDDKLVGDRGDDTLRGEVGNDLYEFVFDTTNGVDYVYDNGGRLMIDGITLSGIGVRTATPNQYNLPSGGSNFLLTFVNNNLEIIKVGGTPADKVILVDYNTSQDWGFTLQQNDGIVTGTSGNDNIVLGYVDPSDGDRVTTGNDTIVGAGGNDTITGDAGTDTFRFSFNGAGGNGIDRVTDTGGNIVINSITVAGTAVATSNPNVFTLTVGGTAFTLTKAGTDLEITIGSNTSEKVILANFPGDWNINLPGSDGIVTGTAGDDNMQLGYTDPSDGDRITTGNDSIRGTAGNDTVEGNAGNDSLDAGAGNDYAAGGDGNDSVFGGAGNDTVSAQDGDDTVDGGDGDDIVNAGFGNDLQLGGAGNDTLGGAPGNDTLDGGTGVDEVSYYGNTSGVAVNLATGTGSAGAAAGDVLRNIENVTGTAYNDTIVGDAGANVIVTYQGDDLLQGGAGADEYRFFFSNDSAMANGVDRVTDTGGNIVIDGALLSGTAVATSNPNVFNLTVGGATYTLTKVGTDLEITRSIFNASINKVILTNFPGDWNINIPNPTGDGVVNGTVGNDNIGLGYTDPSDGDKVTTGNDTIVGGAGNDTITGDAGNDTFRFTFNTQNGVDLVTDNGGNVVIDGVNVAGNATQTAPNTYTLVSGGVTFTLVLVGNDLEITRPGNGTDKVILVGFGGNGPNWNINLPGGSDGIVTGTAGNDLMQLGYTDPSDGDKITQGADSIRGTAGNDTIQGNGGNDSIDGGANDDSLEGGDGDDFIIANVGLDTVVAGNGNDTVHGGKLVYGNDGNDVLYGDLVNNDIKGGTGDDSITGGVGNDSLVGEDGNDTMRGNEDADLMLGGAGNDLLYGDTGNDTIDANGGNDTVYGGDDQDSILGGSVVFGGTGNDTIFGDAGNGQLNGEDGNDSITGGEGNDTIDGGNGNDVLVGDEGNDSILGGGGFDVINANGGRDTVDAGADDDLILGGAVVFGGAGNDTIAGDAGNGALSGGDGNDSITGGPGNDTLDGNAGDDTLVGDEGDDLLRGGDGNDVFNANGGADTVEGGGGDDLILGGRVVFGGAGNDTIAGDEGNGTLDGGDGNDVITGGPGADVLLGGAGNDRLEGNESADTLTGGAGADTFAVNSDGGAAVSTDIITDFTKGEDKIHVLFADASRVHLNVSGGDTLILVDGFGTVGSVKGVTNLDLASDFLFN